MVGNINLKIILQKINKNNKKGILMDKNDKKSYSSWGILIILIVLLVLTSIRLLEQQLTLNNVNSDANNINYLSSSTQRLVRLFDNGQNDEKLLYYIQQQKQNMLKPNLDTSISVLNENEFLELSELILYYWEILEDLMRADEIDSSTLLLAADNHFYQMTKFTDLISQRSNELSEDVSQSQLMLAILLMLFSFIIINNYIINLIELKDKKVQAKLALIDTATGLFNRSKCQELFKQNNASNNQKFPAIMVFDLNELKITNDTYGHRVGDELIKAFASLLKLSSEVHSIPPFIGRYGGDEFIVYYEDIKKEEEIKTFLKELNFLTKKFNVDEKKFQISYAVGYVLTASEENQQLTARQIFDIADERMYQNKKEIKALKTIHTNPEKITIQIEEFKEDLVEDTDIFENTSDDLAPTLTIKHKIIILLILIISLIGLFQIIESQKINTTHINGNILNMPIGDGYTKLEKQTIGNPWIATNITNAITFRALFTPNTEFTDVTPDLATKYEISNNGLTYVITIKDTEKWSDGTPISVEDIVFSLESFLLCNNVNINLSNAFNKITGASDWIEGKTDKLEGLQIDGNNLIITLDSQHNTFLQMLAQFVPLPEHILKGNDFANFSSTSDFFYDPVCSGMYMVDGMDENKNLIMLKNPFYTDASSSIETIVFHWNYLNADIDFYNTANIVQMVTYRAMREFVEYNVDVCFYRYFVVNLNADYQAKYVTDTDNLTEVLDETPATDDNISLERGENFAMSDVRIREAIIHAIDRKQLLSDLYFDAGTLTYGGSIILADSQVYEYNPQKAKDLLIEANYDFDRVFTIGYYHQDPTTYVFLQRVKEYLEEVGLTVEIKKTSSPQSMYVEREYDILLKGLSSFNTEDWYNEYLSTSTNLAGIMDEKGELDELIYALSSTTDQTIYNDTLEALVKLEQELLYKLPLFTLNEAIYINDNRLDIPDDIVFTNTRYRCDLRLDEWSIKKQ